MSLSKTGKSFPEKGNSLPDSSYTAAISTTLRKNLGDTRRAIKTLTGWTGASDRTVKNWLSGANGPSGEHLLTLLRYSDEVLETVLLLAGRRQFIVGLRLSEAKGKLTDALALLQVDGN